MGGGIISFTHSFISITRTNPRAAGRTHSELLTLGESTGFLDSPQKGSLELLPQVLHECFWSSVRRTTLRSSKGWPEFPTCLGSSCLISSVTIVAATTLEGRGKALHDTFAMVWHIVHYAHMGNLHLKQIFTLWYMQHHKWAATP